MAQENLSSQARLNQIRNDISGLSISLFNDISLYKESSNFRFKNIKTTINITINQLKEKILDKEIIKRIITNLKNIDFFLKRPLVISWLQFNKEHPNLTGALFITIISFSGYIFEWQYLKAFNQEIPFYHDFSYYITTSITNFYVSIVIIVFGGIMVFYPRLVVYGPVNPDSRKFLNLIKFNKIIFWLVCCLFIASIFIFPVFTARYAVDKDKNNNSDYRVFVRTLKGANGPFEGKILRGGLDTMYLYDNHVSGGKTLRFSRSSILCVEDTSSPQICSLPDLAPGKPGSSGDVIPTEEEDFPVEPPENFRHFIERHLNCALVEGDYELVHLKFVISKPEKKELADLQKQFDWDKFGALLQGGLSANNIKALKREQKKKLKHLFELANKDASKVHLSAIGFASKTGGDSDTNKKLSERRALAMKEMLRNLIDELDKDKLIKVSDNFLPFNIDDEGFGTYLPIHKADNIGPQVNQRGHVVQCNPVISRQ